MEIIKQGALRQGNYDDDAAEKALQGFMYHARGNGRQDLGDKTLEKAWGKQSIGAIVSGDTRSMEAFEAQIIQDWSGPRATNETRLRAARWMTELQGAKVGASDSNRLVIDRLLNSAGYKPDGNVGLEKQLAEQINNAAGREITNAELIFKEARKYSPDQTEAERREYAAQAALDQQRLGQLFEKK
jgi:CubicO group peptidase (beta-lactamase class C family)